MDKQDEEERLLVEEILTVIEENENCFACRESNGDCVIQEIEMRLFDMQVPLPSRSHLQLRKRRTTPGPDMPCIAITLQSSRATLAKRNIFDYLLVSKSGSKMHFLIHTVSLLDTKMLHRFKIQLKQTKVQ
jgi:hypothetical protein